MSQVDNRSNHCAPHTVSKSLRSLAVVAVAAVLTPAAVPARALPGPIINEVAKLLASDAAAFDVFGGAVAVSGDTAIVGAILDDDNGDASGSAYVFVRNVSGAWTQQAKLLPTDGAPNDHFGDSVSINGDTALVGALENSDSGPSSGSAYIFVRSPTGAWTQQAKLLASDAAAFDVFGFSVSVAGDTAVVGAPQDGDNGHNSGSAYTFVRDATGVWTQQAKLLPTDGAMDDFFGESVAVNGDTIVVGTPGRDDLAFNAGAAYVFVRNAAGVWTQQAKLLASDGAVLDNVGFRVALDGDTAVLGAPGGDDACPGNNTTCDSGAAYVFTRDTTGAWTEQAKLLAADAAAGDGFGFSVAVSGDTAVAGDHFDADNGPSSGSAYVFMRDTAGVWTQEVKLLASDGAAEDLFGGAVAVWGDRALVGAGANDDNGMNSGSAYIFDLPATGNPADLNGDGVVNGADLAALLTQWGCLAPATCPADLNSDGVVNGADLATLLTNWGAV